MVVHLVKGRPEIQGFKLVQESPDLVRVLLVVRGELSDEVTSTIAHGLRAHLGEGMRVEFESLGEIPREKSGKYRTVVSRLGLSPALQAQRAGSGP